MKEIFTNSLALVDKLFDSLTEEEFLRDYLECENNVGPTVREFLQLEYSSLSGFGFRVNSLIYDDIFNKSDMNYKSCIVGADIGEGASSFSEDVTNDSSYGIAA